MAVNKASRLDWETEESASSPSRREWSGGGAEDGGPDIGLGIRAG